MQSAAGYVYHFRVSENQVFLSITDDIKEEPILLNRPLVLITAKGHYNQTPTVSKSDIEL